MTADAQDLARRATADPLFRLAAYALEAAHGRPPAAVWSAPHAFHLAPGLVAAAGWPVAAAAAPRTDGLVRLSSLSHPAHSCDLPLEPAGGGDPERLAAVPDWAARPYRLLRALARAGYGAGGTDLHVQSSLTPAAGLATAEPADCAIALAVADVHGAALPRPEDPAREEPAREDPAREELARLMDAALPGGDPALRRAVLFARPGRALLLDPAGPARPVAFDPPASGARLVLMAVRGEPSEWAGELGRAMECARRAGALSAWPPGERPGRSALVLLPQDRVPAVRAGVSAEFRDRGRPVPRFLNIAVAGAARRAE
ncbi:galactokinase [Streptomyces venezuelae]|uniref:Galactokinase n=1 Tax=Streptomyces venezuelae TaxID=54571 RepID=A0A5P2CWB0_STRVZ|nr:galactokinase [Streptomyces venezuelae]QES47192.1 galactokinase [Streptomyces venezuelae]